MRFSICFVDTSTESAGDARNLSEHSSRKPGSNSEVAYAIWLSQRIEISVLEAKWCIPVVEAYSSTGTNLLTGSQVYTHVEEVLTSYLAKW